MKKTVIAGLMTLLTTAGGAAAGEPTLLTNAQLDRVTAGADHREAPAIGELPPADLYIQPLDVIEVTISLVVDTPGTQVTKDRPFRHDFTFSIP